MKINLFIKLIIICSALSVFWACDEEKVVTENYDFIKTKIIGKWERVNNNPIVSGRPTFEFFIDNKIRYIAYYDITDIHDTTNFIYELNKDTLKIKNDFCENIEGYYKVRFNSDTLIIALISDSCKYNSFISDSYVQGFQVSQ